MNTTEAALFNFFFLKSSLVKITGALKLTDITSEMSSEVIKEKGLGLVIPAHNTIPSNGSSTVSMTCSIAASSDKSAKTILCALGLSSFESVS